MTARLEPAGSGPPFHDVWVPDDVPVGSALARTTDLAVGAHPDDLELMALVPIGACRDDPDRWFTGVVCTDGAGAARGDAYRHLTTEDYVALRRREQCEAAAIGRYAAVVQLGHPSAEVRARDGFDELVAELVQVLAATRPVNLYVHDLADRHETHVAVAAAAVTAVRSLPAPDRPAFMVGCEGWRDLSWLDEGALVRMDASSHAALGAELLGVFRSQIEGGKRYDLAAAGRRRAHAVLAEPRHLDAAEQVTLAMDLTALVHNDAIDPVAFVHAATERFATAVTAGLRAYV